MLYRALMETMVNGRYGISKQLTNARTIFSFFTLHNVTILLLPWHNKNKLTATLTNLQHDFAYMTLTLL